MMRLAALPNPTCGHPAIPGSIACATCPAPEDWRDHASCTGTDPEAFYPAVLEPTQLKRVFEICERCPVQPYCLEEGWNDQHGIWGGWTVEARRSYRRQNKHVTVETIRSLATHTRRA